MGNPSGKPVSSDIPSDMLLSTPPAPIFDTPTTLFTAEYAKQHETRKHPEKAANAAISRP